MWVFTNHGFYSIVRILDTNPEEFWIRSRRKEHLTTYFSEERIIYTHATDYQYRVTINREELIDLFTHLPQEIDYTNFKDSIKDVELKDAAHYVWHDIFGVLDERKGTMGFSEEERSRSPAKNREFNRSGNTGLPSNTQGKNGVVRIEDWKRK
tara:strand:+ start:28129 stop:28587 length:459 start_codon:yes stop_codon:yes gene_type:complete